MAPGSTIYYENPQPRIGRDNFVGSGTSFSAAIVSGLVALLLQANPNLTPDQVKAALLYGASPGPVGSPLVDGHGIANVMGANAVAGQCPPQPRAGRSCRVELAGGDRFAVDELGGIDLEPGQLERSGLERLAARHLGRHGHQPRCNGAGWAVLARCGLERCRLERCGVERPDLDTAPLGMGRRGTAPPGTVPPGTVRRGTGRLGTAPLGMGPLGTTRPGIAASCRLSTTLADAPAARQGRSRRDRRRRECSVPSSSSGRSEPSASGHRKSGACWPFSSWPAGSGRS